MFVLTETVSVQNTVYRNDKVIWKAEGKWRRSLYELEPPCPHRSHSRSHSHIWTPQMDPILKIIFHEKDNSWYSGSSVYRPLDQGYTNMGADPTILALRATLTDENAALAKRFRALFSLKHLASQNPATPQAVPAIEAIAAAFTSPSALLKHELAYCLGQSGNEKAIPFLQHVLEHRQEDAMCRHEAAEALGALGDKGSLDLLRQRRDDVDEEQVVKETCDIAVERIEWEHSDARRIEHLKQRYGDARTLNQNRH